MKGLKDQKLDLSVSHCCQIVCRGGYMAMQWHITLEAGFNPKPVHVEFVVDTVALGELFLLLLMFFFISIFPCPFIHVLPALHIIII
jgi:hypothetical protein